MSPGPVPYDDVCCCFVFLFTHADEEVPRWVDALLLSLDALASSNPMARRPAPAEAAEAGTSAAAAGAAASAPASAADASRPPGSSEQPGTATGFDEMVHVVRPGGLLEPVEQTRVVTVAAAIIRHVAAMPADRARATGSTWRQQVESMSKEDAHMVTPRPGASCMAALQLLCTLGYNHANAVKLLQDGTYRQLFSLPRSCVFPGLEDMLQQITRLLLEDPGTLQAAIEADIRALLTSNSDGNQATRLAPAFGAQRGFERLRLADFLGKTRKWAVRDPLAFLAAVRSTCVLEKSALTARPTVIVRLIEDAPADKQQEQATAANTAAAAAGESGAAAAATAAAPAAVPAPAGGSPTSRSPLTTPHGHKMKKVKPSHSFVEVISILMGTVTAYKGVAETTKASHWFARLLQGASEFTSSLFENGPFCPLQIVLDGGEDEEPAMESGEASSRSALTEQSDQDKIIKIFSKRPLSDAASDALLVVSGVSEALRALTAAVNRYSVTSSVLLKKDGEGPFATGPLLRSLLHSLLPAQSEVPPHRAGNDDLSFDALLEDPKAARRRIRHETLDLAYKSLSKDAEDLLLALCIKSPDARRKILTEIADQLKAHGEPLTCSCPPACVCLEPFSLPRRSPLRCRSQGRRRQGCPRLHPAHPFAAVHANPRHLLVGSHGQREPDDACGDGGHCPNDEGPGDDIRPDQHPSVSRAGSAGQLEHGPGHPPSARDPHPAATAAAAAAHRPCTRGRGRGADRRQRCRRWPWGRGRGRCRWCSSWRGARSRPHPDGGAARGRRSGSRGLDGCLPGRGRGWGRGRGRRGGHE